MTEPDAPPVVSDDRPDVPLESQGEPEVPPEMPAPLAVPTLDATYHISLWSTPVTYRCLRCLATDMDHASILDHLAAVHSVEAVPTPIAADYLANNLVLMALVQPEEVQNGGESADASSRREPEGDPGGSC